MASHPEQTPERPWFTHQRLLVLVLIAATALAFYLAFQLIVPFLPAFAWALALAVVAHPVYSWLAARVRNRNVAAGLAVFVVTVLLVAPLVWVAERLVAEVTVGVRKVEAEAKNGLAARVASQYPQLEGAVRWAKQNIDLRGQLAAFVKRLSRDFVSFLQGSLDAVVQMLLMLFLLFFFFRDRELVLGGLRSLLPLSEAETDAAFRQVADTIHATVYGRLLVALIQGALGGLMFWWLGLPGAVLWGAVMAVVAVIPYLGAFLVWVPAAALLALQGDWVKALILSGWGLLIISTIDNVLYPIIVGHRLRLHTVTAFIAILGGLAAWGMAGLILGPVIVAVVKALVNVWRLRTYEDRAAETGIREDERITRGPPATAGQRHNNDAHPLPGDSACADMK